MAPRRRAVAMACKPATPAPSTSIFDGLMVPAAVTIMGMYRLRWVEAMSTASYPAMDAMDEGSKQDDLYDEVKRIVIQSGRASTTNLQTTFGIGYPRAARLMHLLEENGVIGVVDGKKKVLLGKADGDTPTVESEEKGYGDDPLADQAERDKWQA